MWVTESFYTQGDPAWPIGSPGFPLGNGSGTGFYIGSSLSTFENVTLISPARMGIFLDAGNIDDIFSNVTVKAAGLNCIYIVCNHDQWTQLHRQFAVWKQSYSDLQIDSTVGRKKVSAFTLCKLRFRVPDASRGGIGGPRMRTVEHRARFFD